MREKEAGAKKEEEKGLIHIYCGDGKGKTTAAIGAALRAAGRGKKVLIVRFLKSDDSGEVAAFSYVPGVTVLPCTKSFGFSWNMTEAERAEAREYYSCLFEHAWNMAAGKEIKGSAEKQEETWGRDGRGWDMLILDEAMAACNQGFISEERLIQALSEKPDGMEVILTGRNPSAALLDQADYITEMTMKRHPYERGIRAREGIEY